MNPAPEVNREIFADRKAKRTTHSAQAKNCYQPIGPSKKSSVSSVRALHAFLQVGSANSSDKSTADRRC
jgi:hypothetical protein